MPTPTISGQSRPTTDTTVTAEATVDHDTTVGSDTTATRTEDARGTRWGRFLAAVLPAPSPDRLVPVAQVPRALVPFAEESLADVDLAPVVQEFRSPYGESRFVVLVAARDREVADQVLAGI